MTHPSELISAYLDGELRGEELGQLLDHLGRCGKCSAELDDMQQIRAAVRSLPVLELPSGMISGTEAEVVPLRKNKGMWVGVAAAIVAVVIAVAALVTPPVGVPSLQELNSQFGARQSLDPAFGPAKVVIPPVVDE